MGIQPATTCNGSRPAGSRFWPWLILLAILLLAGSVRVRLLNMPLERDEGEYAYAGQLVLQGIPPYELAYNMKFPGTYFAYALGMMLFGQTIAGIRLMLIVANSLTIIFMYLLGRKLWGATAGLAAAAAYAVMSISPAVVGLAAHANHFVVLFAVPATLLLWSGAESRRRRTIFFSGLLYGLSFLMKQQGIWFCGFGWAILGWLFLFPSDGHRRPIIKMGLVFASGMILPLGLSCLYLAWTGVWMQFWFWTVQYARYYVVSDNPALGWDYLRQHLRSTASISAGFWLLALLALPLAFRCRASWKRMAFSAWFWLASFLATATGLIFREHYFILVLPAFALLVGLGVDSARNHFRAAWVRAIPLIVLGAVLGWNLYAQRDIFFRLSPTEASQAIYAGNPFVEAQAVSGYLRQHATPGDRLAVFGSEPQIYFESRLHSATGYIYTYPLMELQPFAARMQNEMISQVTSNQPAWLVLVMYKNSWLIRHASDVTILRWFDSYAGTFYDRVGVLGARSSGEPVEIWGADAGAFHERLDRFIMVYKRKTAAEAGSAPSAEP